jgi:hypothetical protein
MRITTLCLSLALVATSQAQITIGLSEMPAAGDQLTRTRANPAPFINYGATGPNFTWNFNNLTAAGQDTRTYQSVVSTNLAFTFIFADIFINPNRANHATAGTDIPFNDLLPFEDAYTFFFRSNSVYRKVGFGVEAFGVPLPITMDQQDVIYQLPLNFGNTSSSFSRWSVNVPTLAYYGYEQQRNNVVDGWGTITTPAGTFDALRVKTTLDGRDSIQTDLVSLGFAIERPRVTEYKWLANGLRVPVLQINTVTLFGAEIVTDIYFYDEPRSITVAQPLASSLCPGATVAVNYQKTGVFNSGGFLTAGNIFRAQLSDANGSFATPVNIGSVTSTQSGTINATIPAGTAPGTGYRIRVVSTNPNHTGTDNGFDITIGEAPTALALATDGTQFCAGGTVLLTANTGPGLSYQWQLDGVDIPGADGPELLADATGTFTVAVSNACGNAVSNGVEVTVDPLPIHALTAPSIDICAGGTGILGAENLSGVAVVDYQWDLDGDPIAGATASSILVDGPGTYGVTVTNPATGCIFFISATVEVETVPTPLAFASGFTNLCDGDVIGLVAVASGAASYQWFLNGNALIGADQSGYDASAPGTYTVAAISANGCPSQQSAGINVSVQATPLVPEIGALTPTTFCAGGSVELTVAQQSGTDLQWFLNGSAIAGAEGTELLADASGAYTVVATNSAGCFTTSDAVQVTVLPIPGVPELLADGSTTFCEGASVLLTASGDAGATFQWSLDGSPISGGEDGELTATTAGSYSVAAVNAEGCATAAANSIEVLVDALPAAPAVAATGVTTFCEGGSVALQASGTPDDTYQWSVDGVTIPGAEGPSIDAVEAGSYTVVAINTAGCISAPSAATLVTVLPVPGVPTLAADGTTTFCEGGSVQLVAEGDADATYQWSLDGNAISGGEAGTLTATTGGSYTVAAVNAEGCSTDAADAVVVVVDALPAGPEVEITGPTTFCQGDFVALEASSDAGVVFQWSLDGEELVWAVEALLEAEETGTWTVTATNDAGCSSTSEAIEVTVVAIPADPTISANGATSFCEGTGVTLVADAEGVAYTWLLDGEPIGGANDQQLEVNSAGSYSLVVTVGPGCSSEVSNTIDVEVFFAPAAPVLTRNVDTLFATGSGSFQWFLNGNPIPGATDDQLVVTENGDYTVEITDANGCSTLSAVFPFNSVGMDAAQASGMRVYPNPNDGAFVLELDRTTDTFFTIHDATGKLVQQGAITGPVTQMELREGAGLYFLQIVQAGVPSTHRIVVGH